MLRLAAEEGLRDEEREICVLDTCLLEHLVKHVLHLLPDCISIRLDHHTSPYGRALCQVCLYYKVVIPL